MEVPVEQLLPVYPAFVNTALGLDLCQLLLKDFFKSQRRQLIPSINIYDSCDAHTK